MIHIPRFAFLHTSDAKNSDTSVAFGGLPFGLPQELWPICAECKIPLSFLFQMKHHPKRLPLGKEGRVLYLFQCEGEEGCSSWETDSGCNHVLILEPEELTKATATHPDEDTLFLPELVVTNWETSEDEKNELPSATKWGGSPQWIQYPENPPAPFQFAAQLASDFHVQATVISQLEILNTVEYDGLTSYLVNSPVDEPYWVGTRGSNQYHCQFATFGDAGFGYLFIDPDPEKPTGKFLWQCS